MFVVAAGAAIGGIGAAALGASTAGILGGAAIGATVGSTIAGQQAASEAAQAQSQAATQAAQTQAQAARDAAELQHQQYLQTREDLAPWRETGENALRRLYEMVQAGPGEFTESPGYQFRLSEGQKAIERSAAARGRLLSGATLKGLERFAQDYATNEYQNFLNRYYQGLAPWQSLSGVGQTATTNIADIGQAAAANQANALMAAGQAIGSGVIGAGQARASGYLNQANILGQGVNNVFGALGYFYPNMRPGG